MDEFWGKRESFILFSFRSRYKCESMLGEGAFGRVYSAVRKSDELKVAIKEISKRKIPNYEEGLPLEVKNLLNKTSFYI